MPEREVAEEAFRVARLDAALLGLVDGSLEYILQMPFEEAPDAGVDGGYRVIEEGLRAWRKKLSERVAGAKSAGVSADVLEGERVSALERQRAEGGLDGAAWLLGFDRPPESAA